MTVSLDPIVNTDTFGVWKNRTNEIIGALDEVVSLGDDNSANANGNIVLNGYIKAYEGVQTDTINDIEGGNNVITIGTNVSVAGDISIINSGSGSLKVDSHVTAENYVAVGSNGLSYSRVFFYDNTNDNYNKVLRWSSLDSEFQATDNNGNFYSIYSIGVNQVWTDVLSSRGVQTIAGSPAQNQYQNTTNRPIQLSIDFGSSSNLATLQISTNGSVWIPISASNNIRHIIPPTYFYRVVSSNPATYWQELR